MTGLEALIAAASLVFTGAVFLRQGKEHEKLELDSEEQLQMSFSKLQISYLEGQAMLEKCPSREEDNVRKYLRGIEADIIIVKKRAREQNIQLVYIAAFKDYRFIGEPK